MHYKKISIKENILNTKKEKIMRLKELKNLITIKNLQSADVAETEDKKIITFTITALS